MTPAVVQSCRQNLILATCLLDVSSAKTSERAVGREKLFIHPRLLGLLTSDTHEVDPYE
jgi:hypothetical protein